MKDSADPFVGTQFREYEVLELIGKGGMGRVYKARHSYLEEERAIKIIHRHLSDDEELTERFVREARILSRLYHPNLVRLFEFGRLEENTFFIVMELMHGESVLHRLRRITKFSPREAIPIVRQAALGLHAAHEKGVIHRDISPDNIFLIQQTDGIEVAKVIDFGIAKPLFDQEQFTLTNVFIGKPEYCSPEQCGLLEEGGDLDARSDIYSLAITFYKMLTGRLPFYSATPQGYLVKHATEPPLSLFAHLPSGEVPEELDHLIFRCLEKKKERRPDSMEDFVSRLDSIGKMNTNTQSLMGEDPAKAEFYPAVEPGPVTDPAREAAEPTFEKGKHLYDQGRWQEAVDVWEEVLTRIPENSNLKQWIEVSRENLHRSVRTRKETVVESTPAKPITAVTRSSTRRAGPVIVIGGLVLFVGIAAVLLFLQNSRPTAERAGGDAPPQPANSSPSGGDARYALQRHVNEEYRFSLSVPPTWISIQEKGSVRMNFRSPEGVDTSAWVTVDENALNSTSSDWAGGLAKNTMNKREDVEIHKLQETSVSGLPGMLVSMSMKFPNFKERTLVYAQVLAANQKAYVVQAQSPLSQSDEKSDLLFAILGSFELLGGDPATGKQTPQHQDGNGKGSQNSGSLPEDKSDGGKRFQSRDSSSKSSVRQVNAYTLKNAEELPFGSIKRLSSPH